MKTITLDSQVETKSHTIAKATILVAVFALLYFGMCIANPYLASGSFAKWGMFEVNIRIAKSLNGLRLLSLPANIGCYIGSMGFNGFQGKLALPQYWVTTALYTGIYYAGYRVLKSRMTLKNITVAFVIASIIMNFINAFNTASITLFFSDLQEITWKLIATDIIFDSIVAIVIGYPLVYAYWKFFGVKK